MTDSFQAQGQILQNCHGPDSGCIRERPTAPVACAATGINPVYGLSAIEHGFDRSLG
jgi:hypothetical protein